MASIMELRLEKPGAKCLFCISNPVPINRNLWYNKLYDNNREDG